MWVPNFQQVSHVKVTNQVLKSSNKSACKGYNIKKERSVKTNGNHKKKLYDNIKNRKKQSKAVDSRN